MLVVVKVRTLQFKSLSVSYIRKMGKILTIFCGLLILCGCAKPQEKGAFRHSVCVTEPIPAGSAARKTYTGIVEEADGINLGFKTPGQLKRILVKEVDFVRTGQLLAELDDADYRLGVEALQIQYDQLHDEVERARRLFEKKSMSANDFEKASAGLRQLGVQLEVNKNKLSYTKLYAPVSGYVQSVNFSPAEMVDAGTSVFNLLDVSGMEVVVDIPASLYSRAADLVGFTGRVSRSSGDGWFPLTFLSIVPKADGNQLYRMRLGVPATNAKSLTSGMNMEVAVDLRGKDGDASMFELPLSALFRDADGVACVWVLEADSTVVKRPVTIDAARSAASAMVASGLSGNEKVVRAGVNVLSEGEKVRVIAEPTETNVGGLL